jgi:GH25 family lysozyme M1 (1,4-beta-N-acetylmuramidase)
MQTYFGADISRWQGVVDWPAFNPGAAFVFIKATGGDGGAYVDSQYINNRNGARALGNQMPRGYYHFLGLDPVGEANFFCDNVDFQIGEAALLDEEVPGAVNPVSAKQWLDIVTANKGFKPILYLSDAQILAHDWTPVANAGYAIFPADWSVSTSANVPLKYWSFYAFQQYSDSGTFPGISGNVDCDAFFAEAITDFFKYGLQAPTPLPVSLPVPEPPTAPAPAPEPTPTPVVPTPPTSSVDSNPPPSTPTTPPSLTPAPDPTEPTPPAQPPTTTSPTEPKPTDSGSEPAPSPTVSTGTLSDQTRWSSFLESAAEKLVDFIAFLKRVIIG